MSKISLLFKKSTSRANNWRILRIKNAKFEGYCFYTNTNIQGNFQICISVSLKKMLSLRRFTKLTSYQCFVTLKIAYLQSKNLMLFIRLHALVVFKNMLVKPIETSSPDLMNMVQKLTNQYTSTQVIAVHLLTILCYLHFQMQLLIPQLLGKNYTFMLEFQIKTINGIKFNLLKDIILRNWHLKLISA